MKNSVFKLFCTVFAVAALVSCDKGNNAEQEYAKQKLLIEQKFLTLKPDAGEYLHRAAEQLEILNNKQGFIKPVVERYGYPKWESTETYEANNCVNLWVPVVNYEHNTVGAIIQCIFLGDETLFLLIQKDNLSRTLEIMKDVDFGVPAFVAYNAMFHKMENIIFDKPATWRTVIDANENMIAEHAMPDLPKSKAGHFETTCITTYIQAGRLVAAGSGWVEVYDGPATASTICTTKYVIDWNNNIDPDGNMLGGGGDGDGVGSGGGNGNNNGNDDDDDDDDPDDPKNPCDQLNKQMGQNTSFTSKMDSMKAISDTSAINSEYFLNTTRASNYAGTPTRAGYLGNGLFYIPNVTSMVETMIHTHSKGANSIFSFTDLGAISRIYHDLKMKDPKTFVFGVVTGDGTTYMMMIDNFDTFIAWTRTFSNDYNIEVGEKLFDSIVNDNSGIAEKEAEFIQYLQQAKTGLKLYKGDTSNFKNWDRQTYNTTTKKSEKEDCNK